MDVNDILLASSVRRIADNENAKLDISKLIMEKITSAAAVGKYFTRVDLKITDRDLIDIQESIEERILPLFEHYGYIITIAYWFAEERVEYHHYFECTIRIKW